MSEQPQKAKTNFLAKYVQHFVLDPIKTPAEADKRMKEILPILGIAFGCVIIFILLGNWIEPVQTLFNILGYISMAVVFAFGFFLYKAFTAKKRLKKLQCNNCKEVITYGENVSIQNSKVSFTVSVEKKELSDHTIRVTAYAREYANLEVLCKCQKCGTEKVLRETFRLCEASTGSEDCPPDATAVTLVANKLEERMRACVATNLENAGDLGIRVGQRKTPQTALREFFTDDGSASKTPIGTFTKSK